MYTGPLKVTGEGEGKDPAVLYRRIFGRSRPVQIEFLGVWVRIITHQSGAALTCRTQYPVLVSLLRFDGRSKLK